MRKVGAALVLVFALILTSTSVGFAQTAREEFERGLALTEVGRRAEALEHFERARAIEERPVIVFNIASTLAALGRSGEAIRELRRFLEIAGREYRDERRDAERLIETLSETVRWVTLHLSPESATVEVDGVTLSETGRTRTFSLDPGEHVVTVRQDGYVSQNVDTLNQTEIEVELSAEEGTLVVTTGVPSSTIEVDGREVGRGEATLAVAAGTHEIVVSAPGQGNFERSIDVEPGARVRVDATFTGGRSIVRNPIFWTVVGVVVVGAAVGTALALRKGVNEGTTGITLNALTF